MDEVPEMDQVYAQVSSAWREAGLTGLRVFDTPGWQTADTAVRRYCEAAGWAASPMGPSTRDTWGNWLHILSHCLQEGGHSLAHAKCELELAKLTIAALAPRL